MDVSSGVMKINNKVVYKNLDKLYETSPSQTLDNRSKWVIFSDLHMGDGSSSDDFKRNAELFQQALSKYYINNAFSLLLNGDVEELQKFSFNKILKAWPEVFNAFDHFASEDKLIKTIGNHDLDLMGMDKKPYDYFLTEGYKLNFQDNSLFLYHGHQASKKYQKHNELVGFTLKYFGKPLGIKNYSVSHSSTKQYKLEKKLYHYSSKRRVVSIIGHTHRPLFESLNKVERLKFMIEQLCRDYSEHKVKDISADIKEYKKELQKHFRDNQDHNYQHYVYNSAYLVPCLFNSGTVIGKRGMTCLEVEGEKIRLVHWFDKNISKKYLKQTGYVPERLDGSDFYRMVINEESLEYIFTRIKFLS